MRHLWAAGSGGHLPAGKYGKHGQRVVGGQRRLQASSDVFLDWSARDGGHQQYWRQSATRRAPPR